MNLCKAFLLTACFALMPAMLAAQSATTSSSSTAAVVVPATGYVIGPEDELAVTFWRESELSAEVIVRPDGKISLPLLNEIVAAGLTPEQLRTRIIERARSFIENPSASVIVRAIKSRKVFVTGAVSKPGSYALAAPTTVLQLIALAGGLTEWAKSDRIVVVRGSGVRQVALAFNYADVGRRKNLSQNILLEPGDTVMVPQ
jgi:polysaccharide export outer membrane protein